MTTYTTTSSILRPRHLDNKGLGGAQDLWTVDRPVECPIISIAFRHGGTCTLERLTGFILRC